MLFSNGPDAGVLAKARNDSVARHQPQQLGLDAAESSTSAHRAEISHLGYLEQRNQNRDILRSQITLFLRCFLLDILILVCAWKNPI